MAQRKWHGSGSKYTITWGKQSWRLELEANHPGMMSVDRPTDSLLALDGVAAVGRVDPDVLIGKSLVKVEQFAQRLEATYSVTGWGGLELRASWTPTCGHNGIDLEMQVSASSVGELRGVEAFVVSRVNAPGFRTSEVQTIWVQPRDPRSAGFSYDGRVPAADLRRLTSLPPADSSALDLLQAVAFGPGPDSAGHYMEMVHPNDVARRIFRGQIPREPASADRLDVRYGLFGHDLEKGVIIRARIRGLWISGRDIGVAPTTALRAFLETPLPLGP